jgi:EAL domain-containing protein (putative c-di-GMP-specific phosphodiesterase class I)/ActR/RegA family two-component response regulator
MVSAAEHAAQPPSAGLAYVLDDEIQVGNLVCRVLAACGYKPVQFTSPPPFAAELRIRPPDLVVLDLALGQSDAVEVIRALEVLKYKGKVLLISGREESTLIEVTQIGERHGLTMLQPLRKPFRVDNLKERLTQRPNESKPVPKHAPGIGAPVREPALHLCDALRNDWLELWYQPKIDLKSLSVCGAEALVRARHPRYGIVEPVDLLPPAGDPTFHPLSGFVLKRAFADWNHFTRQGVPLRLAVNMPVSVIHAPDFIATTRRLLPTDPRFPGLIVEVTEDEVIRDPEWVREVATQLKLYNIVLSIDDFGSAYASLSRLQELPFVEVKIDRTFVADCADNGIKHGLCQTVVDLAHRFGATVCAEGVEKIEDLRALIAMGCDTAQGYLFARPTPANQLLQMIAKSDESSIRLHDPLSSDQGSQGPRVAWTA